MTLPRYSKAKQALDRAIADLLKARVEREAENIRREKRRVDSKVGFLSISIIRESY